MKIISSQHYIDSDIVDTKKLALKDCECVEIPCWYIGEIEGEETAIQADGHHTMAAARELGIDIKFSFSEDPEGLTGEKALDARYMDGDWYNVETSDPANYKFDLIW